MSALNPQNGLTGAVSYEYVQQSIKTPSVTSVLRGKLPSYASSFLHTLQAETITVTLPVAAFTLANTTHTATGQQALQALWSISLAGTDVGQIMFTNFSVTPSSNFWVVGHVQANLVNGNGQPIAGGKLLSGSSYQGLAVQVTTNVSSTQVTAAGSISVQVTAILMGTVTQS